MKPVTKADLPRPGKKPQSKATVSEHTRAEFTKLILRLGACEYFPKLDEGVKELLETLIRVSVDLNHAQRIIDRALQYPKCPTPADLMNLADDLSATEAPLGCEKCEGTGRRYIVRQFERAALDENGNRYVYERYAADCVITCECDLGRFLAAKDQERRKSA